MRKILQKTIAIMILFLFATNFKVFASDFNKLTRVQVLNTGQSDAILILSKDFNILIDTGAKEQSSKLIAQLKSESIDKLDYVILTHYHDDHYGGLEDVLKSVKVSRLMLPEFCVKQEEKAKVMKVVEASKVKYEYVKAGWYMEHNDIHLKAIAPTKPSKLLENNNSLVLLGQIGDLRYLFMADAERDLEKQIMKNKDIADVDVIKVAHHGIGTGSYKDFVRKVRPGIAIITSNGVESPNSKVVKNFTDLKCNVFRTDQYGDIMVLSEKDENGVVHLEVYSRKN
ncbi:ComEC/Rec2 family competence protein [Clostridium manihotivorum]|uniref:MBL fold metallo-hydrolase n=1 Tax=Clostridium manihotivorum TaxID=2320868 RepID=A0A410DXT4_9CLOT|nr:MBL fold metallo-hydrolase [Clostridium manihotivorum]QAA33851.1 MBL fold metallo-hydrolase [Clostridium manihotivorum]